MVRWSRLGCLLLPLALATGEPTMERPASGVLDPADAVDHARTRRLAERVDRLAEQPGIALLIVFQRGEDKAERPAAEWLKLWQETSATPATQEATADTGAPATAPSEETVQPALPRAVLTVRLAPGQVDYAGEEGCEERWPAASREQALARHVSPPLTDHNLSGLVHGLLAICDELSGWAASVAAASQAPPAPPEPAPVEPPRPWLNGWWFVGLPLLFWALVLAVRQGPRPAVLALAPLALLYGGLYLLLAFQPAALLAAGVLAFAPLWIVTGEPPPRAAVGTGWQPGESGFGQTGFGAFGAGVWGNG